MTRKPTDRDSSYMYSMWGTTKLVTDPEPQVIKEVMFDDLQTKSHNLKTQSDLHEKIRNDEDYDDWEYGTEPTYGKKW